MPRVKLKTLAMLLVFFGGTSLIFVLMTFDKIDSFLKSSNIRKSRMQLQLTGLSTTNMLQVFSKNSPNISDGKISFPARYTLNEDVGLKIIETCAIVGNSGILKDSNCGTEIDAHDFVLRTNMAPIENYENDVGKQTNLVSMNSAVAKFYYRCLRNNGTFCYDSVKRYLKHINDSIVWFSKLHGVQSYVYENVVSAFRKLKSDVVVAYPNRQLKGPLQRFWKVNSIPSSGMFLYTLASTFCQRVSLYGFYPFNQTSSGRQVLFHYYEDVSFNNTHNMPDEYKILTKIEKAGGLRIVTDACG
ncbi:CMP-N-acetylneuraminate-poly-alpha-2,8-sialyltransferase-like isoform X2 [Antedon mediterranea]|uniref:CMP-N-acetylneuraminate-poly-alpha-2, 8-sialyltransferase-like isoform X2 n=1 Tax=Antedon mediterranea TaxID=105859 RepID=UPI003AF7808A